MFHFLSPSCFQTLPFETSEHVTSLIQKPISPHQLFREGFFTLCLMTCELGHEACDDLPMDLGSMAALVWSPQFMVIKPCFFSCSLIYSPLKTTEVQSMLFSGIWVIPYIIPVWIPSFCSSKIALGIGRKVVCSKDSKIGLQQSISPSSASSVPTLFWGNCHPHEQEKKLAKSMSCLPINLCLICTLCLFLMTGTCSATNATASPTFPFKQRFHWTRIWICWT